MSIINSEKVDGMAISQDKKSIKLLISDHLDWKDEYNHLIFLQEKINAYIMFYDSQQYKDIYGDIDFQYGVFEIHFMYEPTKRAIQFLEVVQKQLNEMGISIECCLTKGEMDENR